MALPHPAAEAKEVDLLLGAFDTLRNDLNSEAVAEIDDRLGDGFGVALPADLADERLVDLQEVDREMHQLRKRGVAGPEIVQSDPDSGAVQKLQRLLDMVRAAPQEDRLGDLDLEALRRQGDDFDVSIERAG